MEASLKLRGRRGIARIRALPIPKRLTRNFNTGLRVYRGFRVYFIGLVGIIGFRVFDFKRIQVCRSSVLAVAAQEGQSLLADDNSGAHRTSRILHASCLDWKALPGGGGVEGSGASSWHLITEDKGGICDDMRFRWHIHPCKVQTVQERKPKTLSASAESPAKLIRNIEIRITSAKPQVRKVERSESPAAELELRMLSHHAHRVHAKSRSNCHEA